MSSLLQEEMNITDRYTPLLAACYVESQVHLIVGANPLAAARCTKSVESGAKIIVIAPDTGGGVQSSLCDKVASGSVQWLRRDFLDADLSTLGREEVDHVVDMVFVTAGDDRLSAYPFVLLVVVVDADSFSKEPIFRTFAAV